MKRLKKFLSASKLNVAVFAVATALALTATVGVTFATLDYLDVGGSRVEMFQIGVSLLENGERVAYRDYTGADNTWDEKTGVLFEKLLFEGDSIVLGKKYAEALSVRNSGTLDEYVRVTIHTYWEDENGVKRTDLDPNMICVNYCYGDNGWIMDWNSKSSERTVLYYQKPLYCDSDDPAGPSVTTPFIDSFLINPNIAACASYTTEVQDGYATITTSYDYDGAKFCIEVEVDAVQTNNAEAAIESAWGIDMGAFGIQQP